MDSAIKLAGYLVRCDDDVPEDVVALRCRAASCIKRQYDAINRLEAIVAAWPTLADGVPIVPSVVGQSVWTWRLPHPPGEPMELTVGQIRYMEHDTEFDGVDGYGARHTVDAERCYSTLAAARAAGGE